MATKYGGVFCKECDGYIRFDQFDESKPRDIVVGPDEQIRCDTCGKTFGYCSYDVKFSSSPDGSDPRGRA